MSNIVKCDYCDGLYEVVHGWKIVPGVEGLQIQAMTVDKEGTVIEDRHVCLICLHAILHKYFDGGLSADAFNGNGWPKRKAAIAHANGEKANERTTDVKGN